MFNTYTLEGVLGQKYGTTHKYTKKSTSTLIDFVHMMDINHKGFLADWKRWGYYIYTGKQRDKQLMTVDETLLPHNTDHYSIVPKIRANKSGSGKGFFGLILGVAMIAVAWWNPMGWATGAYYLGMMGASMALSSAASLLTPMASSPDYSSREDANNRPSYMFRGAVNTVEQGNPMPVIYGHTYAGCLVLTASIEVEDDTDE